MQRSLLRALGIALGVALIAPNCIPSARAAVPALNASSEASSSRSVQLAPAVQLAQRPGARSGAAPRAVAPRTIAPRPVAPRTMPPRTVAPRTVRPLTPSVRRPYARIDRGARYPRYSVRRPGFVHYYLGWWYAFPWWIGTWPSYGYDDRCQYWHDRCVARWGYDNPNYYGCMRYHRCY